MNNDNGSLLEQNIGDKHNLANIEAQGNGINAQSPHTASWNPIMNTGFNLSQENALRLAGFYGNGFGCQLPQTSVNGQLSNGMGLISMNSTGIMPPQISAGLTLPAASMNPMRLGLINLNNAGLGGLLTVPQALMMAAAPPLTTANSGGLSGSRIFQQANVSAGLFTPRQEMHLNSSNDICKERANPNRGKTTVNSQNYCELSTSTQIEESDQPHRDFSQLPHNEALNEATVRGMKKISGTNFPSKLYEILSRNDIADIISWSPHGRSWKVHKPKVFEERIIPQYFRHSKYNSFTRQVNGWGFHRITQGADHNAYYHDFFLRGLPHMCKRMRRLSIAARNDTCSRADPDFYRISELSPLPENEGDVATQESFTMSLQQDSQQNCTPEEEENRKPSATLHAVNTAVAPSLILENVPGLSHLQQQLLPTNIVHPMATGPVLIGSSNVQQSLLVQQAIHNDQIGRSMYNAGFRNMNHVSMSAINPAIVAQLALNAEGSNTNFSRPFNYLGSCDPFL